MSTYQRRGNFYRHRKKASLFIMRRQSLLPGRGLVFLAHLRSDRSYRCRGSFLRCPPEAGSLLRITIRSTGPKDAFDHPHTIFQFETPLGAAPVDSTHRPKLRSMRELKSSSHDCGAEASERDTGCVAPPDSPPLRCGRGPYAQQRASFLPG